MNKIFLDTKAKEAAQDCIQLHGGMGVANEMSIGHFFKNLLFFQCYLETLTIIIKDTNSQIKFNMGFFLSDIKKIFLLLLFLLILFIGLFFFTFLAMIILPMIIIIFL